VVRTRVVALVPAHNEAGSVGAAVDSLFAQTCRPDRVIVVADNCTDATARVAAEHGAEVWSTAGNTERKAGALNHALRSLLPTLDDSSYVLVSDADSVLAPGFVAAALAQFEDRNMGAVGGVFHGEPGGGLLGALQRMEYTRYARELDRGDNVWVLTGTATLHRAAVLRLLAAARGGALPGSRGDVYDRGALTEDMEITLAVKALGYRVSSPAACKVVTEVMPTWSALFRQRVRWQRGAIANLRTYGASRLTAPYLMQQCLMAVGMLAMGLYLAYTVWWLTAVGLRFSMFWSAVGTVFLVERVATVWRMGWRCRALAALMVVEWGYDLFLQTVMVRAAVESLFRRPEVWHHATAEGG
jgi:cellulose synthase/poly-beta-1,6-N-acetylglucosamine synthase-like glycosyltransferase